MRHPDFEQIKKRALLQRSQGDSLREIDSRIPRVRF